MDKKVTIEVNNITAVEDNYPAIPDEGVIAWQFNGDNPPDEVTFKDIVFKDLTEEARAKGSKPAEPERPKENEKPNAAGEKKRDSAREKQEMKEKEAQRRLKLDKELLEAAEEAHNKREFVREKVLKEQLGEALKKLVKEYKDTAAAKEAQKLLDEMK